MSDKTVPLTEAYSAYTQPLEPQILEEIPKKKWAAITALVLSLIAFFTGILVIGFVPAIFAIVFAGIALGNLGGKVLAVQLDGIHTDVHEQIQPVFGAHAVGVTGGKRHSNLTVGGRHKVFLVIYK